MPEALTIRIDRTAVPVRAGTTVAAAILRHAGSRFRTSVTGEPRAALCGMGTCFECRVTVDGRAHTRSCQIECREGMEVFTS
jgi:predicted molibdopterin-dependent oxidoreductase YjgC